MGEINYSHGKKHGIEKWYHENGTLKSEQTFIYGTPQEDMIRWRLDGSIIY
jgi:antitoxin component YwqK of YwqJK toxin-antitoxin module